MLYYNTSNFSTKRKLLDFPQHPNFKDNINMSLSLNPGTLTTASTDYPLMICASFQKPEQAGTNQAKREKWIPEGITTEIPITIMGSLGAVKPIKPFASVDSLHNNQTSLNS